MRGFRETLWFKKGSQEEKPTEADRDGDHERSVEDRYSDDGTLTAIDTAQWSLHTGVTQPLPTTRDVAFAEGTAVGITSIVGEMKQGRRPVVAVIGVSMMAIAAIVVAFVI